MSVRQVVLSGLRPSVGDSALALGVSRPARASLTLRPVRSLTHPVDGPLSQGLGWRVSPCHLPGSYQGVPTTPFRTYAGCVDLPFTAHLRTCRPQWPTGRTCEVMKRREERRI